MRRSVLRAGLVLAAVGVAVGVWVQHGLRASIAPHLPTPKLTLGAYASPPTVADAARWQAFLKRADTTTVNTVVLDLVTPAGVHFHSDNRLAAKISAPARLSYDLPTRVAEAHTRHLFVIARIVVAHNPLLARERPDWAIRTPRGHRWTDAAGRSAVDVTDEDVCGFVGRIAQEAARAGADEVLLDDFEVPAAVRGDPRVLEANRHRHAAHAVVTECARRIAGGVRRARATLGIAVPARLCTDVGGGGVNGQRWEDLVLVADRISPELYPSAMGNGSGARMTAQPYDAVSAAVGMCYTRNLRLIKALDGKPVRVARIEPWIQAYSGRGVAYGPRALGEELRALREHGVGNALLWNGESDFDRFTPALRRPMAGQVVAYNPTPAQWARANRAPRPVGD